jgi:hypothetical protein
MNHNILLGEGFWIVRTMHNTSKGADHTSAFAHLSPSRRVRRKQSLHLHGCLVVVFGR